MKFNDLDGKMREYETGHDLCVLSGIYIVARIDGRNFTRLTKEIHNFEAPFDVVFRDMMIETVKHLMNTGFNIKYGYTQSDEISLLFDRDDKTFGRKLRKLNSILAGEASSKFSLCLNDLASFDCRISQLPSQELVIDYFRWRNEDAFRNALNAHCYWALRREGMNLNEATAKLEGMSIANKNELLFQKGVNFNDLPKWQKRGVGFRWEKFNLEGMNPITGEETKTIRRRINVQENLPMKDKYNDYIKSILNE